MSEQSEAQASQDLPVEDGFQKLSSRDAFVLSLIEDRTVRLQKRSRVYRGRQLAFELVSVSATGVITVLAGINWNSQWSDTAKVAILILGAFTTVIMALKAFHSSQETRILYVRTLGKLHALRNKIRFCGIGGPAIESKEADSRKYFDEFEKIMEDHNDEWRKVRKAGSSQS